MAVADELTTILGVDMARDAIAKLESFKNGVDSVKKTLMGLSVVITGAAATMGLMVKGAADEAMELQKLSEKTGISTDALQEWGYAAKKSGLDAKAITNDLANLQKTMSSPIPGQFNQTMAMFGVSARDASGKLKTTDQLLLDMSGKFQSMSQQKAAQWASKLGISDDTLLLLRKGKDGIEELRKEAHKLGGIIPAESIKRAADFKRQLAELQFAFHGITSQVAIALMPALSRVVDIFKGWMESNREWISLGLGALMGGIVAGFERFWNVLKNMTGIFDPIIDALKPMLGDFELMEWVTHLVTGALTGLLVVFSPLIAKFMLIGAAVAAISLLFEDFFTFLEGGDSYIGDLFNSLKGLWEGVMSTAGSAWDKVRSVFDDVLKVISSFFAPIRELAETITTFFDTFSEKYPALANALSTIGNAIKDAVLAPFRAAMEAFEQLASLIEQGLDKLGTAFSFLGGIITDALIGSFKSAVEVIKDVVDFIMSLLGKVGGAIGKVVEGANWIADKLGFGGDEKKDGGSSAPSTIPVDGKPAQVPVSAGKGGAGGTVINDQKTINQTIVSNDPEQAGQAAADAISGQPPATPGSHAPAH